MKIDARLLTSMFALTLLYSTTAVGADPSCTTTTAETVLNIPDMTVRHDTPIGAEIGTSVVSAPIDTFNCTKGFDFQAFYVKGFGLAAPKINGMNIYKLGTADAGIGYAVYGESVGTCPGFHPIIGNSAAGGQDVSGLCGVNGTFRSQPIKGAIKLVFYKIGAISPGKRAPQKVGSFALKNNETTWVYPEAAVRSSGFTVNTLGCFVDKVEIKVPLGEVGMKQLASVGTTAAEQAFSIPLTCDVGTKVKLTLSAGNAGVYDNVKGLLNLADATSTDTAQGVKIQILSNETPVTYDKALNIGTQSATGTFTIPLKARYYRSAETLKSGTANSSATYTITYE
ncbi:fimbrial protein [Pseudomonas sp. BLCC-B112]|uniref:fimbrial protein n=1 Tax=Pseudomonas sp. BLCC-B112 TaxID=3025319 RepID=UPI00234C45F0|nr:fimbrial protein [Pseudomonas sp. BLCC-B112]